LELVAVELPLFVPQVVQPLLVEIIKFTHLQVQELFVLLKLQRVQQKM
jgi:hypothetical protein